VRAVLTGQTLKTRSAVVGHQAGLRLGLRRLQAYRTEWDESRGVWKDQPRHDEASHGADAFLTFACSNYSPPSALPTRKRSFGWVV
jgi:hypothetical protein